MMMMMTVMMTMMISAGGITNTAGRLVGGWVCDRARLSPIVISLIR